MLRSLRLIKWVYLHFSLYPALQRPKGANQPGYERAGVDMGLLRRSGGLYIYGPSDHFCSSLSLHIQHLHSKACGSMVFHNQVFSLFPRGARKKRKQAMKRTTLPQAAYAACVSPVNDAYSTTSARHFPIGGRVSHPDSVHE
jgi:hypothetical protein